MNNFTDVQAEQFGKAVASLLKKRKSKDQSGVLRYTTTIGTKSDIGLGKTIIRILKEIEAVGTALSSPTENQSPK